MSTTLITTRDKKGLHAVGLFEVAYNQAGLDEDRAQRLNENGGEFQAGIRELIERLSISNQFAGEEVKSNYRYPDEYRGPKPIAEQVAKVAEIFGLDPTQALAYAKNLPELPQGAEGWFAIPSVDALAKKYFPQVTDPAEKYCLALEMAIGKLAKSRPFYNCRTGQWTKDRLRVHARKAAMLEEIAKVQPGDILIVAGQLGMRHRGRSVRRARECFQANEFGLGALALVTIALVHPERLVRYQELDMDCAGDEFNAPGSDVPFGGAPVLYRRGDEVKLGAGWFDRAGERYGSASAFLPQQ